MKIVKQSVELLDWCGDDLSVVNAARVSFAKQSSWSDTDMEVPEKDAKLIKYLAKHKHKSPFNHCFMSFRVKAPIFVARQLVKHEYLPWNEVSRRYVTEEPEFYIPDYWREKADNVKQGSSDKYLNLKHYCNNGVYYSKEYFQDLWPDDLIEDSYEVDGSMNDSVRYGVEETLETYQKLLKLGVCPEQARMVLPQNTMTEWIWSGTLFAFAKMCKLRLDHHTQKETQEIAKMIDSEAKTLYPVSWEALMEYGE